MATFCYDGFTDISKLQFNGDINYLFTSGNNYNVLFVLDQSGSISDDEWIIMRDAVKAAGKEIFDAAAAKGGTCKIQIVVFSTLAFAYPATTNLTDFNTQMNTSLATKLYDGGTNFDVALTKAMEVYSPQSVNTNNWVFFISDGDGAYSSTVASWTAFVRNNNISVTAIAIDLINLTTLKAVDTDGVGSVIAIEDFSSLLDALFGIIQGYIYLTFRGTQYQQSSVFYKEPRDFSKEWKMDFNLEITNHNATQADGFAVVWAPSPTFLGAANGGAVGYFNSNLSGTVPNTRAVAFRDYTYLDLIWSVNGAITKQQTNNPIGNYYYWLDYTGTDLQVRRNTTFNKPNDPIFTVSSASFPSECYIGFTGSTGAFTQNAILKSWCLNRTGASVTGQHGWGIEL